VNFGQQSNASIRIGAERGYGRASAQTIRRTASDMQHILFERSGH